MKELVEYIAKALVNNEDEVKVTELQGQQAHIIELRVAREDVGKIIGRKGQTADAIRKLLSCSAAKSSKRYQLHIIDEYDEND